MANSKNLKQNIKQLEPKIAELETKIRTTPKDYALQLTLTSFKNQLVDLQEQLYKENLKREKEIIEIRLLGNSAKFGSLPLGFVGGITNSFAASIFNTSKYLKFGSKGGKKRDKLIRETIDLRLESLGRGSTIFYLSGKTNPDLFGNSIIQDALENTFNLFESRNSEEITKNISNVGLKSIRYISKFLAELNADEFEVDLKWQSPDESEFVWEGRKDNISVLYNTLTQMEIFPPEEISFEGELITISSKGKFEIQTVENMRFFGNFPRDLLEKMKEFHIGDFCKGIIIKTTIYNSLTEKEKVEYNLKAIE